ncbi:uncharacterized protein Z520_05415 [Fonsecaea multimorphosa CBS 102226]|uniref:RBR-type E3 ubiquitin transferase n=1 Tax=Fonsecaea multimorphosa CBS 102226 TaxID=1442371 RepID=A0A0D2K744_9EURO|nr:uncharacterized protein Z520_05415 [Fonsecaea multimorphosa CBS 102226]KIX98954.1 hypothetical protein Z520_05415 [Fonsecaea multimorphosa CBS 102226]
MRCGNALLARRQRTERHTVQTSRDPGTGTTLDKQVPARSTVTLRRTRPASPASERNVRLREEEMNQFLSFWRGESDTLTLFDIEMAEQTANSSPRTTSRPYLDLSPARIGAPLPDTEVAVGDTTLAEVMPGRLPENHQEMLKQRANPSHSNRTRQRRRLMLSELCSPGDGDPVKCRACFDEVAAPISLDCGHSYCRSCLNQLVRAGTANKMSWPPRCCFSWPRVDIGSIQPHLDEEVFSRYLNVFEEYSTRDPVYCSNKFCSLWIPSSQIQDNKEKFVSCTKCRVQTCVECKQGHDDHVGAEGTTCKNLEELMDERDRKLAETKLWKQCPSCKNLVERIDGCDQIQCSCGTRFCYKCGTNTSSVTQCRCYPPVYPFWGARQRPRQRLGTSQRRASRKFASGSGFSEPNASSSSVPLSGERLPPAEASRPAKLPHPPRCGLRRGLHANSGVSATDPHVNTPGLQKTTQPEPTLYSSLAWALPGYHEWDMREAGNDEAAPPESTYGDSKSTFGALGTSGYVSIPSHPTNADWLAAPAMSPSFEQQHWQSSQSQGMLTGTPRLVSAMQPLPFTAFPGGSQTWSASTFQHSDPSLLSGHMNQPRVDRYMVNHFRDANVGWLQ